MQCQMVLDDYTAYRDYDLTVAELELVEGHLMECQKCREAFENLDALVNKLNGLASLEVSSDFNDRLFAKIAQNGDTPEREPWYRQPTVRISGYAIAAGVALALVFSQWMNPTSDGNYQTKSNLPIANEITNKPIPQPVLVTNDSTENLADSLELIEPSSNYPGQPLHLVNQTP